MIFLTAEDKEISKENKRDPLGLQSIWSYLGGKVIKNITTVSNDFRGFREVLLCLDICNSYLEENIGISNDKRSLNRYILCFEQLFMYSMIEANNIEGLAGGDSGRKKFEKAKKNPIISSSETILVNQIGLGYYGRYKSPLFSMGLIKSNSQMNMKHQEVEALFGTDYADIKKDMFDYFKQYETQGFSGNFKAYKGKRALIDAIEDKLRIGEYEFWLKSFGIYEDIIMEQCYNLVLDEAKSYKQIFETIYLQHNKQEKRIEDILNFEAFIRCVEKAFYSMLNVSSLEKVVIPDKDIKEAQQRYSKMSTIDFKVDSRLLQKRFEKLLKCNPSDANYLKQIYAYHKLVCEQKKRGEWLKVYEDGRIEVYNKEEDKHDIDTWGRSYYLASLEGIAKGLEKLNGQ